jgi:hypothetical protein
MKATAFLEQAKREAQLVDALLVANYALVITFVGSVTRCVMACYPVSVIPRGKRMRRFSTIERHCATFDREVFFSLCARFMLLHSRTGGCAAGSPRATISALTSDNPTA